MNQKFCVQVGITKRTEQIELLLSLKEGQNRGTKTSSVFAAHDHLEIVKSYICRREEIARIRSETGGELA